MTRKIDKRACRRFAMPELTFDLNDGVLHVESCPYIIRTAVRNISGQRILVLYIYQRENILTGSIQPRWVLFQGREDFATLSLRENAKAIWQCSTLDCLDKIYRFDSKCAFYQQQDELRIVRFCKYEKYRGNAITALSRLQGIIARRRALERKWKKQRVILERMSCVPPLPRDLKGFIHREVMPQYIFYDYQRTGSEHAYCTACRHEVAITKVKHNTTGSCPRCKRKITFKSRGRRGRIFDRATAQVLQKTRDGSLLLRIIKVYRTFNGSDLPSYYEAWENARQFITLSLCGQCSIDPYYHASTGRSDLTPWCKGYRPVFNYWYSHESFTADLCGILYHRNLTDTLNDTPWVHSQLEAFAGAISPLEVAPFLSAYMKQPKLEQIIKMKLYRLAASAVYGNGYGSSLRSAIDFSGKNMRAMLGIDRPYFSFLREVDPSGSELCVIRDLLRFKPRPTSEQIKWVLAHEVMDIKTLKELLGCMTLHKLQRYVDEQLASDTKNWPYRHMTALLTDYRDYLDMCRQMQYDIRNTFVLYPRNLKEAHDRVAKELKDKHTAEQAKAIADSFDKWQERYAYHDKELMVIPPHSAKDIVDEGAALHHCVGHYVERVAQNQCVILFVRRVSEPGKPLCTVEVRDGQVIQSRCFGNEEPSARIRGFIEQWKKRVLCAADQAAA